MCKERRINTLAHEMLKPECPTSIWWEVLNEELPDGEYRSCVLMDMFKCKLLCMNDITICRLYDRVLYHTRYKEHRH